MRIGRVEMRMTRCRRVHRLLTTGHREVVDADLSDYFGQIPHADLMKSIARRVSDGRLLGWVKAWLEMAVEEDDGRGGRRRTNRARRERKGTPQGSPISPLFSNIYMRRFILGWKVLGYARRFKAEIVNYADDFAVLGRAPAAEMLAAVEDLMKRLKLPMNAEKTHCCRVPEESMTFLGYRIGRNYRPDTGAAYIGTRPSRESVRSICRRVSELYETLFGRLLSRCQQCAPRHGFRFKNKLYAVDATTIDLCLAVFPWASFRRTKAAIKLHIGLDQAGHLPSFVSVTEGKTGDVKAARTWTFPAGSVVVADRAYLDFKWFHQLQARGVTFVTRLKRGVRYRVTREHDIRPGTGVLSDQTIELTSARSRKAYAAPLRRVAYQDPVTKNRYVFVTNNTTWVAQTIADIYKSRWQIELFFKWIKQHLKVKRFVGRSKNAVMTQLWVAMCMYLLLAYLKFVMRLRWSLHQMLQVLQLNMFERRPLQDLFTTPSLPAPSGSQLSLAWS